jgi:hypothetical protein
MTRYQKEYYKNYKDQLLESVKSKDYKRYIMDRTLFYIFIAHYMIDVIEQIGTEEQIDTVKDIKQVLDESTYPKFIEHTKH